VNSFLGLILVPLVEKAAEHLSAVEESIDNKANLALAHVLGASIQTALLNTPLIVIIGWGLNIPMDLNFNIFDSAVLVLAIIVVGNFLRDSKSNYLEGALCVLVYISIAVCAIFYPNPSETGGETAITGGER
jgi:Ca2+:H+ antiporter